jgi:hypothetical protein
VIRRLSPLLALSLDGVPDILWTFEMPGLEPFADVLCDELVTEG